MDTTITESLTQAACFKYCKMVLPAIIYTYRITVISTFRNFNYEYEQSNKIKTILKTFVIPAPAFL